MLGCVDEGLEKMCVSGKGVKWWVCVVIEHVRLC